MHRSGTSLVARWVNSMGLKLGNNISATKNSSNPDGYYEDHDFVIYHDSVLKEHQLRPYLGIEDSPHISESKILEARKLVDQKNKANKQWGWKDPRTSLFLDLWIKEIKDIHALYVYRDYQQTVDSLLRRKYLLVPKWRRFPRLINLIKKREIALSQTSFLSSWIKHNSEIINHFDPNRDIVVSVDVLKENQSIIFDRLKNSFGFNLDQKDINTLIRREKLKKSLALYQSHQNSDLEAKAKALMMQLKAFELLNFNT